MGLELFEIAEFLDGGVILVNSFACGVSLSIFCSDRVDSPAR